MPQTTEEFRKDFDKKIAELAEKKGRTASGFLSPARYAQIITRLEELHQSARKKSSDDYRIDGKYVIFKSTVAGNTYSYLKDRATNRLHVSTDCIFDAIRTQHLLTGHGARDITNKKLKETHANITKEVIQMYVDLCETCALKKRKVRKSLVVKPIISNLKKIYNFDLKFKSS